MRFCLIPTLVLYFASIAFSQDPKPPDPKPPIPPPQIPLKIIPEKITSDSGRMIKISASVINTAGDVFWDIPTGFDYDISDDTKRVIIVAPSDTKAGDYIVKVYVPVDKKIIQGTCVITIKGPPLPKPPETGLLVDLRIAYAKDGADATNLNNLVRLFDMIQPYCDKTDIKDIGTLMDTVKGASDSIFSGNNAKALQNTRDRISKELSTQITEDPSTTLTDSSRVKIKSVFNNISNVLKVLQSPAKGDK